MWAVDYFTKENRDTGAFNSYGQPYPPLLQEDIPARTATKNKATATVLTDFFIMIMFNSTNKGHPYNEEPCKISAKF